ncbi:MULTISPECIES: clostripain-related cysteine peptidase [unclassified Bradyrhizobium]|uniref:clostripain-related cysteine peptidase n=1 Tax=unclassified Bradyrhizobium TaxID=2631580 RepID=UPI0029164F62|nr:MULTISPECIES: clostripain-related cysteine peptidase [unclassified Bradyrhizobium]
MAVLIAVALWPCSSPAQSADWTVMVYMNAKNNLEVDALDNFYSMAQVGGNDRVNLVVQMGRPAKHYTDSDDAWSGVMRFLVKRDTKPRPGDAVEDLRQGGEVDMGAPDTLAKFVDWSMEKYPATRYMLIIWNHGQGWRFQLAREFNVRAMASSRSLTANASSQLKSSLSSVPPLNGYRSVSLDEDTGNILFNRDIQGVLDKRFTNKKLDVLGFDACLMSMVETAYAFRNSVGTMVGSEELEPGEGWQYAAWLLPLLKNPRLDGAGLAKAVVASYQKRYGDVNLTTLSALDLSRAEEVAGATSALGGELQRRLSSERGAIDKARSGITPYGQAARLATSVDLDFFLERYGARTSNGTIKSLVDKLRASLKKMTIVNYASKRDLPMYGSRGLAIYFPATQADYDQDPDHSGYRKSNTDHPVEFVQKQQWADFLSAYLQ